MKRITWLLVFVFAFWTAASAQSTRSEILGTVTDPSAAAISGAKVRVRSLDTGVVEETESDAEGRFRFRQLLLGNYEVQVEKTGFAKYVQGPITLRLNQNADISVKLEVSQMSETVTVAANATVVNTTNAEVGTQFESKRVSELPLAPDRNIMNLALQVPGVSQLSNGQTGFAAGGVNFSSNGMRLRSNNFMIDGQDSNDPSVTGNQQTINNPDIVAEVRIITNQFLPEYGRSAGSVVNVVTKSGTNDFHGSAFWFHNSNRFNTLNNREKATGVTKVPWRIENQFGGTVGGPVIKNKTFFFSSLQYWTDRQQGFGQTINGAPTTEGRTILQQFQSRPTIKALLDFLPAAQRANGRTEPLVADGRTFAIPLGDITGSANFTRTNWQGTARGDHRFNDKHNLSLRYMVNDDITDGSGQVTPPGLTTISPARTQSATAAWNSSWGPRIYNELRVSYQRFVSETNASSPGTDAIPSMEIASLGLVGINAASSRTAIGLAVNLPQFRRNNTYQIQNTTGVIMGSHTMKFGIDFRRVDIVSFFGPTSRGLLTYDNLQRLYEDVGTAAQINATLPGGDVIWPFKQYDYYLFWQDEWRVNRRLTLTYGLRYETPGPSLDSLKPINQRIVTAAGGNEAYRLQNYPARDLNNWAPRFGFNYRLREKTVLRGGYARSYDHNFVNLTLNVASAFPFLNSVNFVSGGRAENAFARVQQARFSGVPANPATANRTILSPDNRSSIAEQFSVQIQHELAQDWALSVGYVGTKGTGLFQTIDQNPIVPNSSPAVRVNPNLGVVRNRCNCANSTYHSMQASLDKRLSKNFSMGVNYTWSSFIDIASELFNPNALADVAIPQDSFNRNADRGRSTFDRPHRLSANAVWEVPFRRDQQGFAGKVLGGWQLSPFVTMQSGAPFTVLNGADPGGRLAGISGLVGVAIRPNVLTDVPLSKLSVEEIWNFQRAGNRFFGPVTAAQGLGNAGRGILRADGIFNFDLGIMKNTRITERVTAQLRGDFFNLTNTRNFGIPDGRINSAGFMNQWNTDGGRRRIQVALRLMF